MSATENLSYAARFYGLGPSVTRGGSRRSSSASASRSTAPSAPMEDLSRGMQQKVALARALLTSPTLLLLDEPTTGPRPARQARGAGVHPRAAGEHDTTTLLCTHDMAEAEALADRVGILDRGGCSRSSRRAAERRLPTRDARGRVPGPRPAAFETTRRRRRVMTAASLRRSRCSASSSATPT
jgi:ABC-2 type transport system ATP-binding protein